MKRMCRTCGIVFEGESHQAYCEAPCYNAHNWGVKETFAKQADAFNEMSRQLEVALQALTNIQSQAIVKDNIRKIVDGIETEDE